MDVNLITAKIDVKVKTLKIMGMTINILGQELRSFSGGMYPIGAFFHGLCQADPRGGGTIPSGFEGQRSSVRSILISQVEEAQIRYQNQELKGGVKSSGNAFNAFEQKREFERGLWELVSGYNVLSPGKKLEELPFVRVQKTGPAVRLQQDKDINSPEVVFTSTEPVSGKKLDVTLIRPNHSWPEVENWKEGPETDAILRTSNFVDALPYAVLFEDLSLRNFQGIPQNISGNFAFFWSTDPNDRANQLLRLLKGESLEEIDHDPFFQALFGKHSTEIEGAFFDTFRNPVFCMLNIVK